MKFKSTGSVENCKAHHPTAINTQEILEHLKENPKTYLRRYANLFGISHTSVRTTLQKHKSYPYKLQIVEQLHPYDFAARMEFAEEMLDKKILHSQVFLQHLFFPDKALLFT